MEISRGWSYYKGTRGYPRARGRPDRRTILYFKFLESIVLIAGKYDLDPKHLIEAFVEAWRNATSHIGDLKITCREIKKSSATFIITAGEKVISQFPINLDVLKFPKELKAQIQHFPPSPHAQRRLEGKPKKIGQLSYGMKGVNVKAKILEIPPAQQVHTRFGHMASVSNVKIADETGSIRLTLWNDQIDKVHIGDIVEIKKGHITRYRGEPQLRLGRKGTLSIINDEEVS